MCWSAQDDAGSWPLSGERFFERPISFTRVTHCAGVKKRHNRRYTVTEASTMKFEGSRPSGARLAWRCVTVISFRR
jgi:hypothetical protein